MRSARIAVFTGIRMIRLGLTLGTTVLLVSCGTADRQSVRIDDAQTAIAYARPIFGQMDADSGIPTAEPLSATRDGDIWTVKSPSLCGTTDTFVNACEGNVVKLSAKNGAVLYMRHTAKPNEQ
jgi:hypothetical protein